LGSLLYEVVYRRRLVLAIIFVADVLNLETRRGAPPILAKVFLDVSCELSGGSAIGKRVLEYLYYAPWLLALISVVAGRDPGVGQVQSKCVLLVAWVNGLVEAGPFWLR